MLSNRYDPYIITISNVFRTRTYIIITMVLGDGVKLIFPTKQWRAYPPLTTAPTKLEINIFLFKFNTTRHARPRDHFEQKADAYRVKKKNPLIVAATEFIDTAAHHVLVATRCEEKKPTARTGV